jgi:hypothetical protein
MNCGCHCPVVCNIPISYKGFSQHNNKTTIIPYFQTIKFNRTVSGVVPVTVCNVVCSNFPQILLQIKYCVIYWSCHHLRFLCTFRKLTSPDRFVVGPQRDDRIVVENTRDDDRSEMIGTLSISNLLRTDDGLYECIATNEASCCVIICSLLSLCVEDKRRCHSHCPRPFKL